MPPTNKKQRGRDSQKKKEAQQEEQQKAVAAFVVAETEKQKTLRRAQLEAALQGQFGIPAVDILIRDMATEKEAGVVVCYHGSAAEHFVAGSEFLKIVKSYVSEQKQYAGAGVDHLQVLLVVKFLNDGTNIMLEDVFTNFVFALGVSLYLKLTSEEKDNYHRLQQASNDLPMDDRCHNRPLTWKTEITKTPSYELESIIRLGLTIKYDVIPQMSGKKVDNEQLLKYVRDLETERGIIHRLYRETKRDCGCMAADKDRAKDMDKMDFCIRCSKFFPKARTMICDGCKAVVYCSKKCSTTDWPRHKQFCRNMQERKKNPDVQRKNIKEIDETYSKTKAEAEAAASINGLFISEVYEDNQSEPDGLVPVKQHRTTSSDRSQQQNSNNNNNNNNRKSDGNDDDGGSGNGVGGSVVGKIEY